MRDSIRKATVAHESRVVSSHNGSAAIAAPIMSLAVGAYWILPSGLTAPLTSLT
jgi:hypothetical protein